MDLAKADEEVARDGSSAATITTVVDEAWAAPVALHDVVDTVAIIRTITNRTDRNNRVVWAPQCAVLVAVAVASRVVEDEVDRDPETMQELAVTTTLSKIPLPKAPHKQLASENSQGRERISTSCGIPQKKNINGVTVHHNSWDVSERLLE